MATFRMVVKGENNPLTVYLRFRHGSIDITTKINQTINNEEWSKTTKRGKRDNTNGKVLNNYFDKLAGYLKDQLNEAEKKGVNINKEWLNEQIDIQQNKAPENKKDKLYFIEYLNYYIREYLPNYTQKSGKFSIEKSSYKKYNNLHIRLLGYEKELNERLIMPQINRSFVSSFVKHLRKEGYSDNYIGTLIKALKSVCKLAKEQGYKISESIKNITPPKKEVSKIILNLDELTTIRNLTFAREALANACDWLIIGCYSGQRIGDLLSFTKNNIVVKNGLSLLEFTQQKTGSRVILPIKEEVQRVLDKRNGNFPRKISDVKFNRYIKEVGKEAGFTELIKGSKIDPVTKRKKEGYYPKYELITSHIMRRSFATNYYGDIPTPLLMSATGHTTERVFIEYVGKTPEDQAYQLAEYWAKMAAERKKESNLKVTHRKAE